jgi:hypothetical protein
VTRRRPRILIRGGGISAIAVATLLRARGAEVRVSGRARPRGRIVAVPVETLALACDLLDVRASSLRIGPIVEYRRVGWSGGEESTVSQVALVCDAAELAALLATSLDRAGCLDHDETEDGDDADWVLEASGRPTGGVSTGERVGQFARVDRHFRQNELSVTATRSGWIFTAPHPQGGQAVLLVSPSAEVSALTEHEVAERLAEIGPRASSTQVMELGRPESVGPALAEPLWRGNSLKVGDAALALDPLRGDGIGFALRGALLAQAVLARIDGESGRADSLGYYGERLRRAFVAHVRGCRDYYRAAQCPEIWKNDIATMDAVAEQRGSPAFPLGLRLHGRNLVVASSV